MAYLLGCFGLSGNKPFQPDTPPFSIQPNTTFDHNSFFSDPILKGIDNLTVSPRGDILVAEDGDDMQLVALTPNGDVEPVLQVIGHDNSEITGPAFDPSGTRLYFSSQRGTTGLGQDGVTFEVQGPFPT